MDGSNERPSEYLAGGALIAAQHAREILDGLDVVDPPAAQRVRVAILELIAPGLRSVEVGS